MHGKSRGMRVLRRLCLVALLLPQAALADVLLDEDFEDGVADGWSRATTSSPFFPNSFSVVSPGLWSSSYKYEGGRASTTPNVMWDTGTLTFDCDMPLSADLYLNLAYQDGSNFVRITFLRGTQDWLGQIVVLQDGAAVAGDDDLHVIETGLAGELHVEVVKEASRITVFVNRAVFFEGQDLEVSSSEIPSGALPFHFYALHSASIDNVVLTDDSGPVGNPHLTVINNRRDVDASAGSTSFEIKNTGGGTLSYDTRYLTDHSWFDITGNATGQLAANQSASIQVAYDENTSTSARTGQIEVEDEDAENSPQTLYLVQKGVGVSASITVTSPNGGETWKAGEKKTITWSYTGDPGANVQITLWKGQVADVIQPTTSIGSGGSGSWNWDIPASQGSGSDYVMQVTSLTTSSINDNSDQPFTISGAQVNPTITVTAPKYGDVWHPGEKKSVAWTYTGNPGSYVKIELAQQGGGDWETLKSSTSIGTSGQGSWDWDIPSNQSTDVTYRIRVTSTSNSGYADTSEDFSIQEASGGDESRKVFAVVIGVQDTFLGMGLAGADSAEAIWDKLSALPDWDANHSELVAVNRDDLGTDDLKFRIRDAISRASSFARLRKSEGKANDLFILFYNGHTNYDCDTLSRERIHMYKGLANSAYLGLECESDEFWPGGLLNEVSDDYLSALFLEKGVDAPHNKENCAPEWTEVNKLFLLDTCYAYGWWGERDTDYDMDLQRLGARTAIVAACSETDVSFASHKIGKFWRGALSVVLEQALSKDEQGFLKADDNPRDGNLSFPELVSFVESPPHDLIPAAGETVFYLTKSGTEAAYDGVWGPQWAAGADFDMALGRESSGDEVGPMVDGLCSQPVKWQPTGVRENLPSALDVLTNKGLAHECLHYIYPEDNCRGMSATVAHPLSVPYRIGPWGMYEEPVCVQIPLPRSCRSDRIRIYYRSEGSPALGWYAAESVIGWLVPGSEMIVEEDGQVFCEFQVNHSGVVQLGQRLEVDLGGVGYLDIGVRGRLRDWASLGGVLLGLGLWLGRLGHSAKEKATR